jgi:hypothetical protein
MPGKAGAGSVESVNASGEGAFVSQPNTTLGGSATADAALPADPAELEAHIERTRARLVGTVDELAVRLHPKEIARRSALDLRARLDAAIRTPDGSLRVERLAAVGAAFAAMVSLMVWNRRRLRH